MAISERVLAYLESRKNLTGTAAAHPPTSAALLGELTEVLQALLNPNWSTGVLPHHPDAVHALSRAVRRDVPEAIAACARTRWWSHLSPGADPPEFHLDRQLTLLLREARALAATLRDESSSRQKSHSRYLEDRG